MLTLIMPSEVSLRKEMTSVFDSSRYLFILANPGSGGHRLGRIVSCIDNVYWYSDPKNGIEPWNIFHTDLVAGKNVSQYHYDRLVNDSTVPLIGERIEKWWNKEDCDNFYNNVWAKEIVKFQKILETQYIHWVLHDLPQDILDRFPNAKIISLIDTDINSVTTRYLSTTAKFPAFYHHDNLKPDYLNEHAKLATALRSIKPDATERDLWILKNYSTVKNFNSEYRQEIYNRISADNAVRSNFEDSRYKKITWESLNIPQVIDFLNAGGIDQSYQRLL